ncbi:MAG: hypothetical protein LBV12_09985 [Puniceicoccales bacterium]|jgi:hypothetical protein|nr:hypothetical protein [Puniceicoccales bacterium]
MKHTQQVGVILGLAIVVVLALAAYYQKPVAEPSMSHQQNLEKLTPQLPAETPVKERIFSQTVESKLSNTDKKRLERAAERLTVEDPLIDITPYLNGCARVGGPEAEEIVRKHFEKTIARLPAEQPSQEYLANLPSYLKQRRGRFLEVRVCDALYFLQKTHGDVEQKEVNDFIDNFSKKWEDTEYGGIMTRRLKECRIEGWYSSKKEKVYKLLEEHRISYEEQDRLIEPILEEMDKALSALSEGAPPQPAGDKLSDAGRKVLERAAEVFAMEDPLIDGTYYLGRCSKVGGPEAEKIVRRYFEKIIAQLPTEQPDKKYLADLPAILKQHQWKFVEGRVCDTLYYLQKTCGDVEQKEVNDFIDTFSKKWEGTEYGRIVTRRLKERRIEGRYASRAEVYDKLHNTNKISLAERNKNLVLIKKEQTEALKALE